jgi:hypothetical protein
MAITLGVGPAMGTGAPDTAAVITLNGTTAGRGIVVLVCWQDNGGTRTVSSVTISGESNATVVAGSKCDASQDHTQIAVLSNNTGGGNKTITVNMSGSAYITATAHEIAGQDTTNAVDNSAQKIDSTFAPISTTMTTNSANCAIFALCTYSGSLEPTAGTNFTLLSNPRQNNGVRDEDEYWLDSGSAGSKTVGFNSNQDGSFSLLSAVAIKAAAGSTTPKTFTGTDSLAGGELL